MKIGFIIIILLLKFTFISSTVSQDVPRVISYQGVLVGADGKPVNSTSQNPVKIKYELVNKAGSQIKDLGTESSATVVGGLFTKALDLSDVQQEDLNQQLFLRITVNDGIPYPPVPLFASVSALNIADNVVTSAKIKDGEVDLVDLKPGTTIGEILKWDGIKWTRSEDEGLRTVSVNSPITGSGVSGDPLRVSIPSGVPVGTIVAFYGDITNTSEIPDGWLLCDGSAIPNGNEYEKISQICQKNGHAGFTPDLRGQFLRGAGITFQKPINNPDPNFSDRTGGSLVFKVGSVQTDAFQGHRHYIQNYTAPGGGYGIMFNYFSRNENGEVGGKSLNEAYDIKSDANDEGVGPSGTPRTSSETRPKNVYVNYIIKAR